MIEFGESSRGGCNQEDVYLAHTARPRHTERAAPPRVSSARVRVRVEVLSQRLLELLHAAGANEERGEHPVWPE